jgi:hypothetical protein
LPSLQITVASLLFIFLNLFFIFFVEWIHSELTPCDQRDGRHTSMVLNCEHIFSPFLELCMPFEYLISS